MADKNRLEIYSITVPFTTQTMAKSRIFNGLLTGHTSLLLQRTRLPRYGFHCRGYGHGLILIAYQR